MNLEQTNLDKLRAVFPECFAEGKLDIDKLRSLCGEYIDPPYNTGNDFVYADDFADPMAWYKEVTQRTTKSNPETMGRFHTNWLNMMYPCLRLAANLLRDDGVVCRRMIWNSVESIFLAESLLSSR